MKRLALLLTALLVAGSSFGAIFQSGWGEPKWSFYFIGQTFVTSTNSVNVPAGGYATVTFCNKGTGFVHIFRRRLDNNVPSGTAPFLYGGISGTTTTSISSTAASFSSTGPTNTSSLGSLINTYPASANTVTTYGSGTSTVPGTITATGYLSPSEPYELHEPRGLGPGTCQGMFFKNGTPTTTGIAYNIVLTVYWWEQ